MIDQKIHSWKNHCCFLDEADREDPFRVINEFCNLSYQYNWREELFEMFRISLQSEEWMNDDNSEKSSAFWHVLQLIRLTEAVYQIYSAHETGKFTYSYVGK
jgi:hypothetical protein